MAELEFTFAARCDMGLVRGENQDNFYMDGVFVPFELMDTPVSVSGGPAPSGALAVFDGMGGEAMGNFASYTAASIFAAARRELSACVTGEALTEYVWALSETVNDAICQRARMEGKRIGTTMAMLAFRQDHVHVFNVGDSPVFRLRGRTLIKLTQDDTFTALLIRRGQLTEKQAKTDPRRNSLTQHLGMFPGERRLELHSGSHVVNPGDRFLLCTDGLTDMLETREITRCFADAGTPEQAVHSLVAAALAAGGRDNVTAVTLFANEKGHNNAIIRKHKK